MVKLAILLDDGVATSWMPLMPVWQATVLACIVCTAREDTKLLVAPGSSKALAMNVCPPGPVSLTLAVMVNTGGGLVRFLLDEQLAPTRLSAGAS